MGLKTNRLLGRRTLLRVLWSGRARKSLETSVMRQKQHLYQLFR